MRAVHDVGKKICLERFYGLTDCHTSEKPTDTRSCGWILPPTPPLQHCHRLIQDCGQNTEDQLDDIVDLIGRNYGVEQVHLFVAVAADGVHAGNTVVILADIRLHDLFRFLSGDL